MKSFISNVGKFVDTIQAVTKFIHAVSEGVQTFAKIWREHYPSEATKESEVKK